MAAHRRRSGIAACAEGKDYIVIQFKTRERYRDDFAQPGCRHVEAMKSLARRTSGLTTCINQDVRGNYSRKLSPPATRSPLARQTGRSIPIPLPATPALTGSQALPSNARQNIRRRHC